VDTGQEIQAGEFKLMIATAKAVREDGELFVEGVASDTGLDLQEERISVKGQQSMAQWARRGTVALGGEANHYQIAFDDDLGLLVDGGVSDAGEFSIRAKLDKVNPRAVGLYDSLENGKQLGLSVFGKVTSYDNTGDVPTIDGVQLTRVMVTPSPANPRTWLESVAKALPADGGAEDADEPEEEQAEPEDETEETTKAIKEVDSWDGSASRWDTAEAYCSACLIDVNAAAGQDGKIKANCSLPIREPGDGSDTYVRQAVYAAAGGRGIGRVEKPTDLDQDAWDAAVKAAANEIIKAYREMDEYAPDAVYELAGKEVPEAAKLEDEAEDQEAEAEDEQPEEPQPEPEAAKAEVEADADADLDIEEQDDHADEVYADDEPLDPLAVAKGLFVDALRRQASNEQAVAPLMEQVGRIEEMGALVEVLWSVASTVYVQMQDQEVDAAQAGALLSEAIAEFKGEMAAKQAAEDAPDAETEPIAKEDEPQEPDAAEEEDEMPIERIDASAVGAQPQSLPGATLHDVAVALTKDDVEAAQGPAPPTAPPHPAAQAAQEFAAYIEQALADDGMDSQRRRHAVALAVAQTMDRLETALAEDGIDEDDGTPAWARKLEQRMAAVEKAVRTTVDVSAGSGAATLPEDADRPTLPARKSLPQLQPSAAVDRPQSFRELAMALLIGPQDPMLEP
jgi:hypothetical protein